MDEKNLDLSGGKDLDLVVGIARRADRPDSVAESLARCPDIAHRVLYACSYNLSSLLSLRLVSKVFYELSMMPADRLLNPLKYGALTSFADAELKQDPPSEKLEFARKYTNVSKQKLVTVADFDLNHPTNIIQLQRLVDDIKKGNISIGIKVNNKNELVQLNQLISSNALSDDQQFLLSNIKELDLSSIIVNSDNVDRINMLLTFFASTLLRLSFGDIWAGGLKLEALQRLTTLSFRHIDATVAVENLPSLTTLSFENIRAMLTLENLPSLTKLSFGNILINAGFTLQNLQRLTTLSFKDILTALAVKNLPSLMVLSFKNICSALAMENLPRLITLSFGDISSALVVENLPNLTMLSFGHIWANTGFKVQNLQRLRTLSFFGEILPEPTLENLPSLKTLSFCSAEKFRVSIYLSLLQAKLWLEEYYGIFLSLFSCLDLSRNQVLVF